LPVITLHTLQLPAVVFKSLDYLSHFQPVGSPCAFAVIANSMLLKSAPDCQRVHRIANGSTWASYQNSMESPWFGSKEYLPGPRPCGGSAGQHQVSREAGGPGRTIVPSIQTADSNPRVTYEST